MDCYEPNNFYGDTHPSTGEGYSDFLGLFQSKEKREAKKLSKERDKSMAREQEGIRLGHIPATPTYMQTRPMQYLPTATQEDQENSVQKSIARSLSVVDRILNTAVKPATPVRQRPTGLATIPQDGTPGATEGLAPEGANGPAPGTKKDNTIYWIIGGGVVAAAAVIMLVASKSKKGK